MLGLVDSGASHSLIPQRFASALGVDLRRCRRTLCETAGGITYQRSLDAGLEIEIPDLGGMRVTLDVSFNQGVPPKIMILGRLDFFARFRVSIDQTAKAFALLVAVGA